MAAASLVTNRFLPCADAISEFSLCYPYPTSDTPSVSLFLLETLFLFLHDPVIFYCYHSVRKVEEEGVGIFASQFFLTPPPPSSPGRYFVLYCEACDGFSQLSVFKRATVCCLTFFVFSEVFVNRCWIVRKRAALMYYVSIVLNLFDSIYICADIFKFME